MMRIEWMLIFNFVLGLIYIAAGWELGYAEAKKKYKKKNKNPLDM